MIEVRGLTKRYGAKIAVDNLTITGPGATWPWLPPTDRATSPASKAASTP